MRKLTALLIRDVRGIYRDGFLVMVTVYSLVLAALTRVVVGWIPIDHIQLYIAPGIVLIGSGLIGMVFGFALIEERETQTWLLMRVVPLRQWVITSYWIVAAGTLCFVVSVLSAVIYGVRPSNLPMFISLTAVAALGAPLVMLLLGALASNKIEGLAVGKILSSSFLLVVAVFVLPAAWHPLLYWYPWYWIYVGLLRAYAGPDVSAALAVEWPPVPPWVILTLPLLSSLVAIGWLARRYRIAV
jgi:fluoroquinolone transport system permease protein